MNTSEEYIPIITKSELAKVVELARVYPDVNASEIIRRARSHTARNEQNEIVLPLEAPLLWQTHRQGRENPVEFIERVYAPWIGKGLSKADIRRLDRPLYQAAATWISRHGAPSYDLPTRPYDRWIDTANAPTDSAEIRELERRARHGRINLGRGE